MSEFFFVWAVHKLHCILEMPMKYALIVAGGTGSRMKTELPKQFLLLNGYPVIFHTIRAFLEYDVGINIILVLPANQIGVWEKLIREYDFKVDLTLAEGGATRYLSVKNGLNVIPDEGLVAIHDGARPLITPEVIGRTFDTAQESGNAIASVGLKDSLRLYHKGQNEAVGREKYRIVQTPQTFDLRSIKIAYSKSDDHSNFTDDASVLESTGEEINLVEGCYSNIKITTPEDLIIAEALLSQGQ